MAIGCYLLLITSLTSFTFTVDGRFSDEDIPKFLDYIFRLHNAVRLKHNVPPLTRTENMNLSAFLKLNGLRNVNENDKPLGQVSNWMYYDKTTKLNVAEAIKFFSLWYEDGNFYNYESNPITHYADKFTQTVWKDTRDFGITFRYDGHIYEVLAVYYPPGNILGRYTSNVFQPINNLPVIDREIDGLIYQTEKERFLDCLLELHNEARTKHWVLPLERDYDLDDIANYMLRRMMRTPTEEYGVNSVTMTYDTNIILSYEVAKEVFLEWYNREEYYTYEVESATTNTMYSDDFTQIVWQNTQKIGLGIQKRHFGLYEVIAVYKPPGNIRGQFARNVFRPRNMDQGGSLGNN